MLPLTIGLLHFNSFMDLFKNTFDYVHSILDILILSDLACVVSQFPTFLLIGKQ